MTTGDGSETTMDHWRGDKVDARRTEKADKGEFKVNLR
jgi:hypothetical protein